ncbi:hypothetical protein L596_020445 [Steinernema carpocapsae]|uniref:Uncharacterized protein n=1 Tax=Steinernema carpocapsae TaxID=34508 RepID=A0A4U5MTR5_STECR|nr:hypothetical protein L596_020445 [Steinernema carpocapsae]
MFERRPFDIPNPCSFKFIFTMLCSLRCTVPFLLFSTHRLVLSAGPQSSLSNISIRKLTLLTHIDPVLHASTLFNITHSSNNRMFRF